MEPPVWNARQGRLSQQDLEDCLGILESGGILAVPTETVYGLAVDGSNETALLALCELKGRPEQRGFALQVAEPAIIGALTEHAPSGAYTLLQVLAPGPITVVLQGSRGLPDRLTGEGGSIGIRIPDHPVMLQLLRVFPRPLAVTSANRTDHPPAVTVEEIRRELVPGVQGIVDAGPCRIGVASTVVDFRTDPPTIAREGAVPVSKIWKILEEGALPEQHG